MRESLRKARKGSRLLRVDAYRRALRLGVAAAVEHETVPLRSDAAAVLDIGAHSGQFAILARRKCPAATIYCFEPQAGPRDRLSEISSLLGDTEVLPIGLGETTGKATMYVSQSDDSSSMLPISDRQVQHFPSTAAAGTQTVAVRRLDDVAEELELEAPFICKMDVQGFELQVLRGGAHTVSRASQVLIELSFVELYVGQPLASEVVTTMGEMGMELRGVFNVVKASDGSCLQGDFLFGPGND